MSMHPAVKLLLKRIESHPERFNHPRKWTWALNHVMMIATTEEGALIRAKLREVAGSAVHTYVMGETLK
jgi:hypothetical protein